MSFLVKTSKTTLVLFILCTLVVLFPACKDKSTTPAEPDKDYVKCTITGGLNIEYDASTIIKYDKLWWDTKMTLNNKTYKLYIQVSQDMMEGKTYEIPYYLNQITFRCEEIDFFAGIDSGELKLEKSTSDFYSGTFKFTIKTASSTDSIKTVNGKFYFKVNKY